MALDAWKDAPLAMMPFAEFWLKGTVIVRAAYQARDPDSQSWRHRRLSASRRLMKWYDLVLAFFSWARAHSSYIFLGLGMPADARDPLPIRRWSCSQDHYLKTVNQWLASLRLATRTFHSASPSARITKFILKMFRKVWNFGNESFPPTFTTM